MLRHRFTVAALLAAVALTAQPAVAGQAPNDAAVRAAIVDRLDEDGFERVTVTVERGVATLDGSVSSLWLKNKAVEEAVKTEGVVSVASNLTIERGESDEMIVQAVATQVRRYVFYTIFDSVDLEARDGHLTLTGYVDQPYKVGEIGKLASKVTGVQALDNQIEVLPASIFDQQLRAELAVRIYNHTLFQSLAFQPNPPVHIVVKNSRVILTGVVNSEIQRRVAEHIVRGTFGVLSVENRLRLDSDLS